jgi:4-hydroxy-tetrahydrodipicolinate synthase
MTHSMFSGTGVAIITPFDPQSKPDHAAMRHLVGNLAENGVDVIVVLGTTGESVTLFEDEQKAVIQTVVEANAGRCTIMVGIGGNHTAALEQKIARTDFTGIDGILSVSPYYNKPVQEGIARHYEVLSSAAPVPMMLYNVPGRTGSNMSIDTTLRIAHDCKNVVGIKEASGNMEQIMTIMRDRNPGFLMISGDDALTLPIIAAGGDGAISVVANAFPQLYSAMVRLAMENRISEATPIHSALLEFTRLMFADGSPGGIKAALKVLGLCNEYVRLPLVNVRPEIYKAIEKEVHTLKHFNVKLN